MECPVCELTFNVDSRKPTLLPCAHTFCLACVKKVHHTAVRSGGGAFPCPTCRAETQKKPSELLPNFFLLNALESAPSRRQAEKYWCTECKKVADTACHEQHVVCTLPAERFRHLRKTKESLDAAVASQNAVEEMLVNQGTTITESLARLMGKARAARQGTEGVLDLLNDSRALPGPEWEDARRTIDDARERCIASQAFDQQTLDLARSAGRCEVLVHGQQGQTWRGEVSLQDGSAGSALVLAMVTAMQRDELLQEVPVTQAEGTSRDEGGQGGESAADAGRHSDSLFVPRGQELGLDHLSADSEAKKSALLVPLDPPVTSVWHLYCNTDPDFSVKLLRCHGPTLERLQLNFPTAVHMQATTAMPRLRELEIFEYEGIVEQRRTDAPANPLRLDLLDLRTTWNPWKQGLEKRLALIALCGGARRIETLWHPDWPMDCLVGHIKEQASRADFTMPRAIVVRCVRSSQKECAAWCTALREALPGVSVWCKKPGQDHRPRRC